MTAKFKMTKEALGMVLNIDSNEMKLSVEEVRETEDGCVEILVNTDNRPEFDGKDMQINMCPYRPSSSSAEADRNELIELHTNTGMELTTNPDVVPLFFVGPAN